MSSTMARKTWEIENNIALVDPARDFMYGYDKTGQKAIRDAQPWKQEFVIPFLTLPCSLK